MIDSAVGFVGGTARAIGGLDRRMRMLFGVTLLYRAGLMAFPYLSAYLLIEGAVAPWQVGVVISAFGVGALLADLSSSLLLRRLRPGRVMSAGLVLHAAALLCVPAAHGLVALLVATLAWGFTFELYTPASYAVIVARAAPAERKLAFACNRLAINIGMGVGPAVGGVVFALDPLALFWINAGCALVAAALLLRLGAAGRAGATPRQTARARGRDRRAQLRFWVVFVLALPVHLAYALPPVLVSAYLIEGLHQPSYRAGIVFAVNAVLVVLIEVPLNTAMAGLPHARSLLIGFGLAGCGFTAMGVCGSFPVILAATVVWTFGEMVVFPSLLSYITDLSGRPDAARNLSVYSGGVNIGTIVAPAVAVTLSGVAGPGSPWVVIGIAVLVAAVLLLAARSSEWTWHRPAGTRPDPC